MKKMFISILLISIACFFSTNCKKSEPDFSGQWEIIIEGTCVETKTAIVNNEGKFKFSINCNGAIYNVDGNVDMQTGETSAKIFWGPLDAGTLDGYLDEDGYGQGTFTGFLGLASGDWTAKRL